MKFKPNEDPLTVMYRIAIREGRQELLKSIQDRHILDEEKILDDMQRVRDMMEEVNKGYDK